MRSLTFGSALALALGAPITAFAATIPLQDGEYTRGACTNGAADITESIGLYTRTEGPKRGTQFLAPNDEEASGSCSPERMKVSGARYSGRAPCLDGSRQMASGVYDFDIKVVDRRTFTSRGTTYRWCSAHR